MAERIDVRGRAKSWARTAVVSSVALATAAHAQNTAPPGEKLQDIVVTAQKREQNLQTVPIAVTAISGKALEVNRIRNVADLSSLAPNLTVRPAAGGSAIPAFSLRGVISYGVVPGSDKETSIYVDGVYIGSPRASIFDIPDISRIEVLRGPQGTLFGRNATAGAISITTRDPTGQFHATQQITVGNYNQLRTRTSVDLPKLGPFSAYFSFVHDDRRGAIKNLGAGTVWDRTGPDTGVGVQRSPKWLGSKDVDSWFGAVKFEPSDNFKTVFKFDHSIDRSTPDGVGLIGIDPNYPLIGNLLATLIATSPNPLPIASNGKRPNAVNNSWSTPGIQRNEGFSLTSTWRVADNVTLKNIAAYRKAYQNVGTQIDGMGGLVLTPQAVVPLATFFAFSEFPPAQAPAAIPGIAASLQPAVGSRFGVVVSSAQSKSEQWSDEFQLNYDSKWLTLTAGAIWFRSKDSSGGPPGMKDTFNFTLFPDDGRIPLGNVSISYNKATSLAAYTQAEGHLTSKLDLIAGVRITDDKKSGVYDSGGTFVPATPGSFTDGTFTGVAVSPFKYKKTRPSFSIGLNYKPTKDMLLYAKYSDSFVSGGAIGGVGFKPEVAKSWEAGAKADLLDRHLRTNLALFYVNYYNQQLAQAGRNVGRPDLGTVIIDQEATTRADGFEFETTAVPVKGLTLGAGLGYTHIKFVGTINPIVVAGFGGSYGPALVPKWTGNLTADYETEPLFGETRLLLHADTTWRGREQLDYNPTPEVPTLKALASSPPSWILNARIALTDIKIGPAKGEIAIWGRNLTNDRSENYALSFNRFLGTANYQDARTYGIDLTVRY